jgi:hypothetical protein
MKTTRYLMIALAVLFFTGCTHPLHVGFDKYLTEHPMEMQHVDEQAGYTIDDATMNMVVTFRSAMAGIANKWQVNVGSMVKDYMDTEGPKMFAGMKDDPGKKQPLHLDLKVTNYKFEDMSANITMQITATRNGKVVVDKAYSAKGLKQTGKMFWGGAAGMRHSVHQSTQYALNDIMNALAGDLK